MCEIEIDPERSARVGEPVPVSAERERMRREGIEHINVDGRLEVPVWNYLDPTPIREGWEPYWVNVNLDRKPVRWITYRRPKGGTE